MTYNEKLNKALYEIGEEAIKSKEYNKTFTNKGEAVKSVIDELNELTEDVPNDQQRKEAAQAAAMLVRFIVELT